MWQVPILIHPEEDNIMDAKQMADKLAFLKPDPSQVADKLAVSIISQIRPFNLNLININPMVRTGQLAWNGLIMT